MYSDILRARADTLKNTSMEVDAMCDELRKIELYGMEKGMEKGIAQNRRQNALQMLQDGLPHTTIARYTGLTTEEVDRIAAQQPA